MTMSLGCAVEVTKAVTMGLKPHQLGYNPYTYGYIYNCIYPLIAGTALPRLLIPPSTGQTDCLNQQ